MKTWWTGLPDRSGMAKYVVLIRGKDDPKRAARPGLDVDPGHATRWKEVNKTPPEEWRKIILRHMQDGQERTWNRIVVEITGAKYTADTVFEKNPEKGLWLAVERGELEYTPEAPILFRLRSKAKQYEGHTGKTVKPAAHHRVPGFAVYDNSTIKKQREGKRLGATLLFPKGPRSLEGAPKTLEEARKIARDWTALTGHSTTVKEDGIPVAHYSWDAEMSGIYTEGWTRGKTAVTNGERFGIYQYARPSSGAADSGYLAGVVWDGDKRISWVPLTSLTKVPRVPSKAAAPKRERRVTAEEIIDPGIGGAEARLQAAVDDAIRLYGTPKRRRQ